MSASGKKSHPHDGSVFKTLRAQCERIESEGSPRASSEIDKFRDLVRCAGVDVYDSRFEHVLEDHPRAPAQEQGQHVPRDGDQRAPTGASVQKEKQDAKQTLVEMTQLARYAPTESARAPAAAGKGV